SDSIGFPDLMRQGTAQSNRDTGADDRISAQHANGHIGHMHRTSASLANALGTRHEFEKERRNVDSFCKRMSMTAMGRSDGIVRPEHDPHCRGNCLLTDTQMNEAGHFAIGEKPPQPQLHESDAQHASIHVQQIFFIGYSHYLVSFKKAPAGTPNNGLPSSASCLSAAAADIEVPVC